VVLSIFGLVLVLHITWGLLKPLIPVVVGLAVVVAVIVAWNRVRWR
jgi:hypothetical protein